MTLPQTRSEVETSLWAIGIVRTGREDKAKALLEERGCDVWFPTYFRWTRPSKGIGRRNGRKIERACIPGYLFIRYESLLGTDWDELAWLRDFRMFLRRPSGDMALLDSEDMSWLEKMGGEAKRRPVRRFWRGQRVRIPDGPWGGLTGRVQAVGKHTVHVLLDTWDRPIACRPEMLKAG